MTHGFYRQGAIRDRAVDVMSTACSDAIARHGGRLERHELSRQYFHLSPPGRHGLSVLEGEQGGEQGPVRGVPSPASFP